VYGFVDYKALFDVSVPANATRGFVAYGTTTYGYADFDNLVIEDDPAKLMKSRYY